MGKLECIQSNSFLVAADLRCRTSRRHGTDPLRRICNPTLLDIRIFNPQTRFNYICFEAPLQQATSQFRNKTTTFALTP